MERTISSLIASADGGDAPAADSLFVMLYDELRRQARRQLARNAGDSTLGTTTLLHEAYLGMASRDQAIFPDRARFMAYASRVMRGLIIDHARNRKAHKRGGAFQLVPLEPEIAGRAPNHQELSRIGQALDELAAVDPALAELVDLRFFCGFSFAEIAAMRGQSDRTVQRHWERARIYLHRVIGDGRGR